MYFYHFFSHLTYYFKCHLSRRFKTARRAADGQVWTKMIRRCLRSEVSGPTGSSRYKIQAKRLAASNVEAQMGRSAGGGGLRGCCSCQRKTAPVHTGSEELGQQQNGQEPLCWDIHALWAELDPKRGRLPSWTIRSDGVGRLEHF